MKNVKRFFVFLLIISISYNFYFINQYFKEMQVETVFLDITKNNAKINAVPASFGESQQYKSSINFNFDYFTENRGQLENSEIILYSHNGAFFSQDKFFLEFTKIDETKSINKTNEYCNLFLEENKNEDRVILEFSFIGANKVIPRGNHKCDWDFNYFIGKSEDRWNSHVTNYYEVIYEEIWDGIDLIFHYNDGKLKYEYHISPYADPNLIKVKINGHKDLSINTELDLEISTEVGVIKDVMSEIYYKNNPSEVIQGNYKLIDKSTYCIDIEGYDKKEEIIIDPLIFGTYVGGSSRELPQGLVVDSNEHVYFTGWTNSVNFPVTPGAYNTTLIGYQGFIFKLNASGDKPIYGTFFGGPDNGTVGRDIFIDTNGFVTVSGETTSKQFPVSSGAFDSSQNGNSDCFIIQFNQNGSKINCATYIGGSDSEYGHRVKVDKNGDVFLAGETRSLNFPTSSNGVYRSHIGGSEDAYILKFNKTLGKLIFGTYLGGSNNDWGRGFDIDLKGNSYICGFTSSTDLCQVSSGYDRTFNQGLYDGYVIKLNPTGQKIIYSTYLGGSSNEAVNSLVVDDDQNVFIIGSTESNNFPTTNGSFDQSLNGGNDIFTLKLNNSGNTIDYSTLLGGIVNDIGREVQINSDGEVYLYGEVSSADFPTTPGCYDPILNKRNLFVSQFNNNFTKLKYSTFIGGGNEWSAGFDIDEDGDAYGAAYYGTNFPTTPGAMNTTNNGGDDAIIFKVRMQYPPSEPTNISADIGDSFVNLTWNEPNYLGKSYILNYTIYRGLTQDSLSLYTSIGNDTWFNDTNVVNGVDYYYQLIANNTIDYSNKSSIIKATPFGNPSEPINIDTINGPGFVNLTWDPPLNNGGDPNILFNVYYGTNPISLNKSILQLSEYWYNFTSLKFGIKYYFGIKSLNNHGLSSLSLLVSSIPRNIPSKPINVSAIGRNHSVHLSWAIPINNGGDLNLTYNIYRGNKTNPLKMINTTITKTFFNDTRLINGMEYYYRISANNSMGESPFSSEITAIPINVPSMPTNFIKVCGNGFINLSWDLPIDDGGVGILNFNLYKNNSDNNFILYSSVPRYKLFFNDTNVINGFDYSFRISAVNIKGEGDFAGPLAAIPRGPPSSPINATIFRGPGYLNISWEGPLSDGGYPIEGYRVYRKESGVFLLHGETNDSYFIDLWANQGVNYSYYITAVNEYDESIPTPIFWGMSIGIPSPPYPLMIGRYDGAIKINWSSGIFSLFEYDITHVRIYRNGTFLVEIPASENYFNDTGLINGVVYKYQISSVNILGEGDLSDEFEAVPGWSPSAPRNLTTWANSTMVKISWDPPEFIRGFPVDMYIVYRKTDDGRWINLMNIPASNNPHWNDSYVEKGNTYEYKVIALNQRGASPQAGPVSATTPMGDSPERPGVKSITLTNEGKIEIEWNGPQIEEVEYSIFRKINENGTFVFLSTTNGLVYSDTPTTRNVTYYYYIIATNQYGDSPSSEVLSIFFPSPGPNGNGGDPEYNSSSEKKFPIIPVIIAGVILLILIISLFILISRRKKEPEPTSEQEEIIDEIDQLLRSEETTQEPSTYQNVPIEPGINEYPTQEEPVVPVDENIPIQQSESMVNDLFTTDEPMDTNNIEE